MIYRVMICVEDHSGDRMRRKLIVEKESENLDTVVQFAKEKLTNGRKALFYSTNPFNMYYPDCISMDKMVRFHISPRKKAEQSADIQFNVP